MIRRFFIYLSLIFTFTGIALIVSFYQGFSLAAEKFALSEPAPRGVILLIPLDSRPPCTNYVSSLARMAGFQVLLPPAELLDNYRRPANTAGIRDWLTHNISRADAAIISADMLVHGGLLASRKGLGSIEKADEVLALFTTIHEQNPKVKLYAFNIIPRLLISDDPQTEKFKQPMLEWSVLQETATLFENPNDFKRLHALEVSIPAEIPARYRKLYSDNHHLNQQLVSLIKSGVLSGLVLGQDDSAAFGLGNMERQRLEDGISNDQELQKKIFITRGTDEVALSMLDQVTRSTIEPNHKVYIHYTEPRSADVIMPYMPRPLSQTVAEKLAINSAIPTDSPLDADYILVVHAGSTHSHTKDLAAEADEIRSWIENGKNVVLVDLAVDWTADQTLLPYLQRNGTPLHRLIAYAGWNTASNSVGTAITQAAMIIRGRNSANAEIALYRDFIRAKFLSERIVDDWYYQKIYRPILNGRLQKQKIDPYDLRQSRQLAENQIKNNINNAQLQYIRWEWRNAVFPLFSDELGTYAIGGWEIRSGLPWDRTFEIFVDATAFPARIIQH